MSSLFNPLLGVSGLSNQIDRAQAQLDWGILQRAIALNTPTLGTDPTASGADYTGAQDSTNAIQQILNSTSLIGQLAVLYLRPNSIFTIFSPLTLQTGVVTFIYGGGTIQLSAGANCNAIQSPAAACQLVLRDIVLVGGAGSLSGVKMLAGTNSVIENCSFFSWGVAGVNITPSAAHTCIGFAIVDSLFAGNTTADINLDSTNGAISGIRIADNQLDSPTPLKTTIVNTLTYTARGNTGLTTPLYDASFDWPTPKATAYQTGAQSIPNTTNTALSFNTASINQAAVWAGGSPTRFTAPTPGLYLAIGQVALAGGAAGSLLDISMGVNGGGLTPLPYASEGLIAAGPTGSVQVSATLSLNSGDYVQFFVLQASGVAQNTVPTFTWGSLTWLSNP